MPAKNKSRKLPGAYLALVQEFPLMHIRDERHLDAAQAMIDRLLQANCDEGANDYLDALTDLVETYEDNEVKIPDASEADVLRELMRSHALTQASLAKKSKISQSTLSAVLNGVRSLTKEQVIALATVFHVSPNAFLRSQ